MNYEYRADLLFSPRKALLYGLIIVEKVLFVNELFLIIHAQNDCIYRECNLLLLSVDYLS